VKAPRSHPNPALYGFSLPDGVPPSGAYYWFMRLGCQILMPPFWRIRVFDRHHEPARGGAVYIANHQSFLDPMLVGFGLRRPLNYMARASLFRMPGFRQLIRSVNAFPVRRGTADTGAMKEAMRRIKNGGQVLVFAEGTRTQTGHVGAFLPGVALLSRRAARWTVPVMIDGAFEAWPRTQRWPGIGNIVVRFGEAISQEEARKMPPHDFVAGVRNTIISMQADARRRLGRKALDYDGPPPNPGAATAPSP